MSLAAVQNIAEAAMAAALTTALAGLSVPPTIYVSDAATNPIKVDMPYVVIHADNYAEEVYPGCGLFKVTMQVMYRSHVQEDTEAARDAVVSLINQCFHEKNQATPASPRLQIAVAMSTYASFYVHGFVPTSGSMRVNVDYKAYEYVAGCELYCKPSSGP
jgi:hypothetical protein